MSPLSAQHAAIRKVLQHHGLTEHGDGVVEADLIAAMEGTAPATKCGRAQPTDLAAEVERLREELEVCCALKREYQDRAASAQDPNPILAEYAHEYAEAQFLAADHIWASIRRYSGDPCWTYVSTDPWHLIGEVRR